MGHLDHGPTQLMAREDEHAARAQCRGSEAPGTILLVPQGTRDRVLVEDPIVMVSLALHPQCETVGTFPRNCRSFGRK